MKSAVQEPKRLDDPEPEITGDDDIEIFESSYELGELSCDQT